MNNELKKELEELKQKIEAIEKQLEEETKEDEFKDGDPMWVIFAEGRIAESVYAGCKVDKGRLAQGNVKKTEEEAKNEARRRELMTTLKRIIKEKNQGWKPDWEEMDQVKCCLEIYSTGEIVCINTQSYKVIHDDYYIKDYDIAKQIRKENKELLEELKQLGWIG